MSRRNWTRRDPAERQQRREDRIARETQRQFSAALNPAVPSAADDVGPFRKQRTVLAPEVKAIIAAQMRAVAEADGNLTETARQLSRHYLVRIDTITTNWRRWRLISNGQGAR